jgi:hypothetical protein
MAAGFSTLLRYVVMDRPLVFPRLSSAARIVAVTPIPPFEVLHPTWIKEATVEKKCPT